MKYSYDPTKFPSNVARQDEADVSVFGVPFEATTDYLKGTANSPKSIRTAAHFIEPYDIEIGKNLFDVTKIADVGDVKIKSNDTKEAVEAVREFVSKILLKKQFFVMLGGEHTISLGAIKSMPESVKIISFDAHYDLKEVWEGSQLTHNTWLRRASEIVGNDRICLIGVRTGDEFEFEYAKNILVNPTIEQLQNFVKGKYVYVSIDMDIFDPSVAPGVGTPEPDGFSYRQVLNGLKMVNENANRVIGMDVVEARPMKDDTRTEIIASKLIFKSLIWNSQK